MEIKGSIVVLAGAVSGLIFCLATLDPKTAAVVGAVLFGLACIVSVIVVLEG